VTAEAGLAAYSLTDREFTALRNLIYAEAGLSFGPSKKALLVARLSRRLRDLGFSSFSEYVRHVTEGRDHAERLLLLDCVTTHETHFFREPRQFEFLERDVYPAWRQQAEAGRRARHVRVWSAGCSTGEEPFSIAMSLLHHFPAQSGFTVEILATDLSSRVLERARQATWPISRADGIPQRLRKQFMLRGVRSQQGLVRAGRELRAVVRFERLNLNDAAPAVAGEFDLIFCRNVLIYFDARSRLAAVTRLIDRLAPRGHLLVGHAESLNGITSRVRGVAPTIYALEETP
jgi:chemotaxis protein methyltransferase CheR